MYRIYLIVIKNSNCHVDNLFCFDSFLVCLKENMNKWKTQSYEDLSEITTMYSMIT